MSLTEKQQVFFAITVAALGYFVDVFDITLFSTLRVASLKDLGLGGDDLMATGALLLNCQLAGMLLGGLLFGIYGDKKGRLKVLFGSILLYSVANIGNALVDSVEAYAFWRFVAGIGLAGELGAGITLVGELLPVKYRGYGTIAVTGVGCAGAVAAGLIASHLDWRTAYVVGGMMGLVLLVLRFTVHESGLFEKMLQDKGAPRGSLGLLFGRARLLRYLAVIMMGAPFWFVFGVLVTFAPEIAAAAGVAGEVLVGRAFMPFATAVMVGDIFWGFVSQALKSRRKTVMLCLAGAALCVTGYFLSRPTTPESYYAFAGVAGFFCGYWVTFITMAAEQFGTNLRATVATSAPNFARGLTIGSIAAFTALKGVFGAVAAALAVGGIIFVLAFASVLYLRESFARDLDYVEI